MDNFLVPVYLGKSSIAKAGKNKGSLDSYYFYSQKNGLGRFVKYANYPYWAAASNVPDSLVLEDPPESVVTEVHAFVSGKVEFTVIPKTRGRSEVVLRKEVSYNQENGVSKNVATEPNNAAQRPDTSNRQETHHPRLESSSKVLSPANVLPPSPQSSQGVGGAGSRNVRGSSPQTGTDGLRRLPDLGRDGGFPSGLPGGVLSPRQLPSAPDGESGARRVPDKRILGNPGSGSGRI